MDWFTAYPRSKPVQLLMFLIVLVSLGYLILFIGLSAVRSLYPFELEWIEGASVDEINWIMQGKPLYGEPSISFIPSMKTPLFFFLSAGLAKVFGIGFFAPRLLSILASIGIMGMVFLIVKESGANYAAGLLSAGLVAASFRFTGAWMDLSKTDVLCMFFLLVAFFVGQKYPEPKGWVVGGILYILAYFTKQIALVVIILICLSSLVETRGRSLKRWLATGIAGLGIFILVDRATNGWFSFYSVDIIQYHTWQGDLLSFIQRVFAGMWPAILIILIYLFTSSREVLFYKFSGKIWQGFFLSAALFAASGSVFLKSWTYDNGFIPTVIGMAILLGIGFDFILRATGFPFTPKANLPLKIAVIGLVLVQFAIFFYDPQKQLPTEADKKAGQEFVSLIKSFPGNVLVFNHGYYNQLAGKPSFLHSSWIGDVTASSLQMENPSDAQRGQQVVNVLSRSVREQIFDRIIVDNRPDQFLPYYVVSIEPIFKDENVFFPVTGARSRPTSILVRNPVSTGGSLPLTDPFFSRLFVDGWTTDYNHLVVSGEKPSVQIALEQGHDYQLTIQLAPLCHTGIPVVSSIRTSWNGKLLRTDPLDTCMDVNLAFDIGQEFIEKKWNQLQFYFGEPSISMLNDQETAARVAIFKEISFIQK